MFERVADAGGAGGPGRGYEWRVPDVAGDAQMVYAEARGVALRGDVRGGYGREEWRFAETQIAAMLARSGAWWRAGWRLFLREIPAAAAAPSFNS